MKKTNMIATVSVLIALVCATLFFFNWNPEVLFKLNVVVKHFCNTYG